jgi:hypothetical protein
MATPGPAHLQHPGDLILLHASSASRRIAPNRTDRHHSTQPVAPVFSDQRPDGPCGTLKPFLSNFIPPHNAQDAQQILLKNSAWCCHLLERHTGGHLVGIFCSRIITWPLNLAFDSQKRADCGIINDSPGQPSRPEGGTPGGTPQAPIVGARQPPCSRHH